MASLNPPANAVQFAACFPDWPADSLERRIDIEAGSKWGLRELGSFKLLRKRYGGNFPLQLDDYDSEATRRVQESPDVQNAASLLRTDWRKLNRSELLRSAGLFASFFSHLAELLEQPPTPNPDRVIRTQPDSSAIPYTEAVNESTPSAASSESEYSLQEPPAKRLRETLSEDSSSYNPSNQSDQSTFDRQVKSEFTTNACVFHFLQCVTESTRNEDDESRSTFRLEWALTQDTFVVKTPESEFSSTNDGNLVYRDGSSGAWKRRSNLSYCSIEAKSHYHLTTNAFASDAQEGAHIIGMLSQRLAGPQPHGGIGASEIIPLISARQNMFYLVIGTFPESYHQYLRTGNDTNGSAFGQLNEYGPFDMREPEDFETMCRICVALVLHLEDVCARGQS